MSHACSGRDRPVTDDCPPSGLPVYCSLLPHVHILYLVEGPDVYVLPMDPVSAMPPPCKIVSLSFSLWTELLAFQFSIMESVSEVHVMHYSFSVNHVSDRLSLLLTLSISKYAFCFQSFSRISKSHSSFSTSSSGSCRVPLRGRANSLPHQSVNVLFMRLN